ncbi:hypothetical protein CTheo_4833 [Ceratobasidium theobromae]|uniref:Angiogenic factor with G patch and FHA domains 1 n=1 Tax=Ceratobasidium theobromae TaxID=1582974 RepID=A0A5N5QJA3_9AGAM|nr:hypothetical protein CTheo_4833 [Ceratobasidium theobromae]
MSHGPSEPASDYCTEFEWPGGNEAQPRFVNVPDQQPLSESGTDLRHTRATRNSSFLRLTVLSSTVLSRRAIIIIDSFDEVSIGRDRCATPRLRLKELAASKYHASIYWDSQTGLWSLVDMGSTHGTYLISPDSPAARASGSISSQGYGAAQTARLSPPKTASLPRTLSHLQHIVIGGTTFVVHMHADQIPCDACAVTENNLVDLSAPIAKPEAKYKESEPCATSALKVLKRNLLSRPSYTVSARERTGQNHAMETYMDRAELRRQRYPGWRDPKPPKALDTSQDMQSHGHPRTRAQNDPRIVGIMDRNPELSVTAPISFNNVGHKLLMKQGWAPGSALGPHSESQVVSRGLLEPLTPQATANRRGLGMGQK